MLQVLKFVFNSLDPSPIFILSIFPPGLDYAYLLFSIAYLCILR
jgi:hypothetical protein